MNRIYFFKAEDGTVKKCYYCSFCGKGPFIEDSQLTGSFFIRGSGRQPTVTCRSCDIIVFPGLERAPLIEGTAQVPKLEPLNFKKYTPPTENIAESTEDIAESTEPVIETPPIASEILPEPVPVKIAPVNNKVKVGQMWEDKDKRRKRKIKLTKIEGDYSYYIGGSNDTEIRITTKRLLERFKLIGD